MRQRASCIGALAALGAAAVVISTVPAPAPALSANAGASSPDNATVGCADIPAVRASVGPRGRQPDGGSGAPSISGNGRFVAFHSVATNLVRGDTNERPDIFVYDRETRETSRVSVATNGTQGDHISASLSISRTGRFVVFGSLATNLVRRDTNGMPDAFLHDRDTGRTVIVSVSSTGQQGRNLGSGQPAVSARGRFVAFVGYPSNLVPGDTNGKPDIFVRDRRAGTTTRVSVSSSGVQANRQSGTYSGPDISADGRYVVFESDARTLVKGDTNGWKDVFLHDRWTHRTTRVSVGAGRAQGDNASYWPSISGDGRYVAFSSRASNLVDDDENDAWDVFVRDRKTGVTTLESRSTAGALVNDGGSSPMISGNGRFVTWGSYADNLVPGDTNGVADVFVRDRVTGSTWRVPCGPGPDGESILPSINDRGTLVAFESIASNLVDSDTNGVSDIFLARSR